MSTTTDPTLNDSMNEDFAVPSVEAVMTSVAEYQPPARDYVDLPENLAGNYDVAKAFCDAAGKHYRDYIGSAERVTLEEKLQNADAKFRMAPPRVQRFRTGSSQTSDNLSNVASSQFYKSVTLLSSAINSVLFGTDGASPVEHKAPEGSSDYTPVEAERIAAGRTACFANWWAREEVERKCKEMVLYAEKNSIEIFTVQWQYETKTRIERVPGYYDAAEGGSPVEFDPMNPQLPEGGAFTKGGEVITELIGENGRPLSYVFVEKTRVVKNCPIVERVSLKKIQWDLTLPMCDQVCVVIRSQKPLSTLLSKQRDGEYMNVELLGRDQMYADSTRVNTEVVVLDD